MLRTVHDPFIIIIVTVLCSGICGLRIKREDAVAVTDKLYGNSNLDPKSFQFVEPLLVNENDVEKVPEDNIDEILRTLEDKQNENEEQKDTTFGEADNTVKQRVRRQAAHQYTPLYPQLPSGPPYNPYQPQTSSGQNPNQQQPGYNPYTQNPNQQQPGYNPYAQNPNQQQTGYNPYTQNPNQQQPAFNPYGQNGQQPAYNPYGQNGQQPAYNPYGQNGQQPAYNPYGQNGQQPTSKSPGQGQFPQRPPQWNTNNSSQPSNLNYNPNTNQSSYGPSAGQSPYNTRPNFPSYNNTSPGSPYRPPSGQYPHQNQTFNYQPNPGSFRPQNASGSSFTTPLANWQSNPRPGQPPYNNYPTSSGNGYPVQYNNNTRPNPYPNSQYPNSQYPNYPGARPAQGTFNVTQHQVSPYFPGPDGKFPSNSYNPSIPNYPPQNNNQGRNNFFYPQNNNSASYDPRRVPPQNFSY